MTPRRIERRIQKLYGAPQPLVRNFLPRGRSESIIYAVVLREHPEVVKVGRTTRWANRRKAYACWNLANGDGILDERVFIITDEFVDLPHLEAHVLSAMPFPIRHGNEWFTADLDEVCRLIDQILCAAGLSYI